MKVRVRTDLGELIKQGSESYVRMSLQTREQAKTKEVVTGMSST